MDLPDFILPHWTLVQTHPRTFVAAGLVALGAGLGLGWGIGYGIGRARGRRRMSQALDLLERRGQEIARLSARATALARMAKNPDAIVQNDTLVGSAMAHIPGQEDGLVVFERIEGNGEFKPTAAFSYRGRIYRIEAVEQMAAGQMRGVRTQIFGKVTARRV